MTDRRRLLQALTALGCAALLPPRRARGEPPKLDSAPFQLGIASGFPTADSVVLWTRLAPQPLQPQGGMPPFLYPVYWEIASDEAMSQVVARGNTQAVPAWSHSVHAVARGLLPARDYWYRFTAAGHRSPVGRTRTLPAAQAALSQLDLAVVCCQNYEAGHYAGYRHIAAAAPDLLLHLGDYIYEYGASANAIRQHNSDEIRTLAEYRARYALYKSDPQLQAAHAASPWLCTWDDHEVENDYSGVTPLWDGDPVAFLARRTAAYRAYFENMPLPPQAAPAGTGMPIHAQRTLGQLASIVMLDQRQYRSPKACMKDYEPDRPPELLNCDALFRADRTMLGSAQEQWLGRQLKGSHAHWTLLAQGTIVSHVDEQPGAGRRYSNDNWNGFPAARDRLIRTLQATPTRNPVILTGDVHAFVVGQLTVKPAQPESAALAPEFVASAISSGVRPQRLMDAWRRENPNLSLCEGDRRGYLRLKLTPKRLQVDLMAITDVRDPDSAQTLFKSLVVEAGRPDVNPA